jgi:AcrR family transcriptional regulator
MNTKTDPRVRRTRRLLREALVSLILEKDYASISIKDITDRAEVAYITFLGTSRALTSC